MSWGYKITLLYTSFAAFIIFLVTVCVMQDDIHLVSKEYYKEEIAYQSQIDKMTNAKRLGQKTAISYNSTQAEVQITIPDVAQGTVGEIVFFRPADARQDVRMPIHADAAGKQSIAVDKMPKGLWRVKINWASKGKAYFDEQVLVIG